MSLLSRAIELGRTGWGGARAAVLGEGLLGRTLRFAGVGAGVSWLTGGGFWQGAFVGALGGHAGGAVWDQKAAIKNTVSGFGVGGKAPARLSNVFKGVGESITRRSAGYLGAGLGGMIFGGNRRSHARGFNSTRGSRL